MESGFNYWFYDNFDKIWFYGMFEREIYDNFCYKYYVIHKNGVVRNYIAFDITDYVQVGPAWIPTRT